MSSTRIIETPQQRWGEIRIVLTGQDLEEIYKIRDHYLHLYPPQGYGTDFEAVQTDELNGQTYYTITGFRYTTAD